MSAPPPPPPYAPPPYAPPRPPTVDPRWTSETIRAQRRSAKMVARQQRSVDRAQRRALRRRSLLGPFLLVALGVVLLAVQLGHLPLQSVLDWLSHWWPLVLVAAGLVLLCDWVLDSWFGRSVPGSALPRRQLGAGPVLLVLLLIAAGLVARHMDEGFSFLQEGNSLLGDSWGLDQIFAQHADLHQTLSAPLAGGALLTIQNYAGNITVTGSSQDGLVHVSAHQRLWAWKSHELREHQERSRPLLQAEGAGLRLSVPGENRDQTDLTVEVPRSAGLSLMAEKGEVSLSEIRGPITIADHQGNIELTAITGPLDISSQDDDADITGHSLSGTIQIRGRAGDLTFSDLTGSLDLHGDFFGTTHLARIQAPVHFQSSFTELSCAAVAGDLQIIGRSDLNADGLTGPVLLSTTDRSLTLHNLHGPATVTDQNGPVRITLAGTLGPINVQTSNATIKVNVPQDAAFRVSAETSNGKITTDLGLPIQDRDGRSTLVGQVRTGGPQIKLRTTDGNLSLKRGEPDTDGENSDNQDD